MIVAVQASRTEKKHKNEEPALASAGPIAIASGYSEILVCWNATDCHVPLRFT